MTMRRCEFFLVRYVPDLVKGEFVNVGLVASEALESGRAAVQFTRDWRRARCLDPNIDIEVLEGLEAEIRLGLEAGNGGLEKIHKELNDKFSNCVQLTAIKGHLAENLTTAVEELTRVHIQSARREKAERRGGGRQAIHAAMRLQFERSGVWDLMQKKIAASKYTRAGDTLRIDCGYRPNGVIRMFHAVSLQDDVEAAKVLAFSIDRLREGVRRAENAALELTALVEPLRTNGEIDVGPEQVEQYEFGKETMEEKAIGVLAITALPQIAEGVRKELHV